VLQQGLHQAVCSSSQQGEEEQAQGQQQIGVAQYFVALGQTDGLAVVQGLYVVVHKILRVR
jgi:hypothetical protein